MICFSVGDDQLELSKMVEILDRKINLKFIGEKTLKWIIANHFFE
jgi:hypothetical protein